MIDEFDFSEDRPLLDAIAAMERPAPPGNLTAEFMSRARTEHVKRRGSITVWIAGMAATFIVSAGAGWLFQRKSGDVAPSIPVVLLAQSRSLLAEERLGAIATLASTHRIGDGFEEVITGLLVADENTAVRLAAIEALTRIAKPPTLHNALVRALQHEASPFVQLALLAASDSLPHSDRRDLMQVLVTRAGIDPLVMGDAHNRLGRMPAGDSR